MKYIFTTLIILFTVLVTIIIFVNYDNIVKVQQGEIIYTYAFKNEMNIKSIYDNLSYIENVTFHRMNTGVGINWDYIEYDIILYISTNTEIKFRCTTVVNGIDFTTDLGIQYSDVYIGNRYFGFDLLYQDCIINSPLLIDIDYLGNDNYNVSIPTQTNSNLRLTNVIPFNGSNIINGMSASFNFMANYEPSIRSSNLTIDKIFDVIEYVFWTYPRYVYLQINTMLKVVF